MLHICGRQLTVSAPGIFVVALGKAARTMALGLEESLGTMITAGVVSGPSVMGEPFDTSRWQTFEGGHPLPNTASLAAARAAFELLDRANKDQAIVIFLVSGGGSAMIEWPINEDISLDDLRSANRTLVACGASINEINSVRRCFSSVKGGGLARRATRSEMISLIISDTNSGDEASVASGPTISTPANAPVAAEVIRRYRLEDLLPTSILQAATQSENRHSALAHVNSPHYVLLDNQTALEGAARKAAALGFTVEIAADVCEQEIESGSEMLLSRLDSSASSSPPERDVSLLSGGEFSCPVRGDGKGGRNLETALRCAIKLNQNHKETGSHTVVLSAGTDGTDGNSPAAGGIADETTIQRATALGMDAMRYLERSDSHGFFERLGNLVMTGPTGTNVRDLRVMIRSRAGSSANR